MKRRMDGWKCGDMDGCIDGCMDEGMKEWTGGCMDG